MFKFKINLNKENFLNSQLYKNKRIKTKLVKESESTNGYAKGYYFLYMGVFAMLAMNFKWLIDESTANIESVVILIFTLLVLVVFHFTWGKYTRLVFIENQVSENGTVLGDWDIEIDDKGILRSKPSCTLFFSWKCVEGIESDNSSLYIFLDTYEVIILPKEQIPNDLEEYLSKKVNPH